MTTRIANRPIPLSGLPDGLEAFPIYEYRRTAEGEEVPVKNRQGLHKVRLVALISQSRGIAAVPDDPFLLGASERRWPSIAKRYGRTADHKAVELAQAGLVHLVYEVDKLVRLGKPIGWKLMPGVDERRLQVVQNRLADRDRLEGRAARLAEQLDESAPEVAAALRNSCRRHESVRVQVLIHVAEDLLEGVTHDGPRAFSQAHFGSTKLRADAADVLIAVGVPERYLVGLGLVRASRFGVAGVIACVAHEEVRLDLMPGMVLVTANPSVRYRLSSFGGRLAIVENLQAAEAIAAREATLAVIYTAGLPSQGTLRHIAEIAEGAERTALIPDADLGGVRIAEAILSVVPSAELVDIGRYPHPPQAPFGIDGVSIAGLRAAKDGAAGGLARAVLRRGYPVEQELAITAAIRDWLKDGASGS